MTKREQEYFKCYSWKLKQFIATHSIYPISSGINSHTDKVYHVYEMTDELSRILHNWSKHKKTKK